MSAVAESGLIRVATLEELRARNVIVVPGADRPIAVFVQDGDVTAVDNRCPHLGFPLHKGTVRDGILTCHWHEARFDLCSGCTFDLWADDVAAYDTEVRDGVVYVAPLPRRREDRTYYMERLRHGLEHGIGLVQAKAILGLQRTGASWEEVAREIALFGAAHHDKWGEGMTMLALVARLMPHLGRETGYYALLSASRQVAEDCLGAAPHHRREPLGGEYTPQLLTRWMRSWIHGRHREGAERVVLTAVKNLGPSPALADLLFSAASERVYADTGHLFDFTNNAFELLDHIGWEHASAVLPLIMPGLVAARGAEEQVEWHHPVDVIVPLRELEAELAISLRSGRDRKWDQHDELPEILLGDDPLQIMHALKEALRDGAAPVELSKHVAYAAALRLVRFPLTNEVDDWFSPRHTFIFANAVHQAVKRSSTPGVVRGIFHAALAVYMDRFLNVPAARLPEKMDQLPTEPVDLREHLLSVLNTQAQVDAAAAAVAWYMELRHPVESLIDTLTLATVREDLDFHALQVLEAGVQQYAEWEGQPEGTNIMVGVVRQLAAFCPTPRAGQQTANIALRLQRGDRMYEEA